MVNQEDTTEPPADGGGSGERIQDLDIATELRQSYLKYAMSVIVDRALPDVRDGLKPSQRRILVAMNDLNLSPSRKTLKCAKVVGETMGNYHPHGDQAIYPTLVRMAQPFNMSVPLVQGQGNFGSIDRRPARVDAVHGVPHDPCRRRGDARRPRQGDRRLPAQLRRVAQSSRPCCRAAFPNLLINGGSGIAVAMASSIPPHNPSRRSPTRILAVLDDPEISAARPHGARSGARPARRVHASAAARRSYDAYRDRAQRAWRCAPSCDDRQRRPRRVRPRSSSPRSPTR